MFIKIDKILSKKDQIIYFKELKTETDPEKIGFMENELFLSYYKLVVHIAKRYNTHKLRFLDGDDLKSIGSDGLLKAIRSYKLDKEAVFATYATTCIKNEIGSALKKYKNINECSLDSPISSDEEGNSLILGDIISDDKDMAQNYVDNEEVQYFRNILRNILNKPILSDKEKKFVILRYGIYTKEILNIGQVAKIMNISHSSSSNLNKTSKEKIQKEYSLLNKKKEYGLLNERNDLSR